MIRYSLQCKKGHGFESWFASSDAFDKLQAAGEVRCPQCGSKDVEKALMAPQVSPRTRQKGKAAPATTSATSVPVAAGAPEPALPAELRDMIKRFREEVVGNSEYVGPRFAEEARKIHYEETEARSIYGEASLEEAKALHEEGVEFMPIPRLPEDSN